MAVETHIHALPRTAPVDTVYPMAVMVFNITDKTISIGDGNTVNGVRVAMLSELENAVSAFLEQEFSSLIAPDGSGFDKAGFNNEIYIHHLVSPSGTIYTVASGDCEWSDGYTYLKMDDYWTAEGMPAFSGTWIAVYNPRPSII